MQGRAMTASPVHSRRVALGVVSVLLMKAPYRSPEAPCRKSSTQRISSIRTAHSVETPGTTAGGREVEKEKTVEDRGCALVEDRPEALRGVGMEVRDGHLAREYEGHGTSEQPEQEEQAAERLQDAGEPRQRSGGSGASTRHDGGRNSKQLGGAHLHEEKRGNNAQG